MFVVETADALMLTASKKEAQSTLLLGFMILLDVRDIRLNGGETISAYLSVGAHAVGAIEAVMLKASVATAWATEEVDDVVIEKFAKKLVGFYCFHIDLKLEAILKSVYKTLNRIFPEKHLLNRTKRFV